MKKHVCERLGPVSPNSYKTLTFAIVWMSMSSMLKNEYSYKIHQQSCYRHREQAIMVHIRGFQRPLVRRRDGIIHKQILVDQCHLASESTVIL